MTDQKIITAAAYCRVSSLLGQRVEQQATVITDFARHRSYELVEIYIDEGISGAKERRPDLDRMLSDAKKGRFKVLICVALDRLGRDVLNLLNLLRELQDYGVSVISLREGLDFSSNWGKALATILAALAEFERGLVSERVKMSVASRRIMAEKSGTPIKLGRPKVVTESMKAEILKLRSEGVSLTNIAKAIKTSKGSVLRVLKGTPAKKGGGPDSNLKNKKSEAETLKDSGDIEKADLSSPSGSK